jgi:geranylgeranyl diphosphate synthase, type II
MSPQEMKAELKSLGALVEGRLATVFGDKTTPPPLAASMEYSLMAGGKRLRPVLCLAWAELVGGDAARVLDFACAIECIHTYSLIHDDLPAMDNDDLRRGKPSNHKKFDEATAILAGDGLLTEAFTLAASLNLPPDRILRAIFHLSTAAGPRGMVGGQILDMGLTGKSASLPQLREMHAKKTGALIESSCVTGCILGGGGPSEQGLASEYGRAIGLAFQVTDDILDVVGDEVTLGKPVGSDEAQGKSTYPALMGIEKSRLLARESVDQAVAALAGFAHPRADFLRAVALYILDRTH